MAGQPIKERIKSVSTGLIPCFVLMTVHLLLLTCVTRLVSNVRNARNAAMGRHQRVEIVQRAMLHATTLNEDPEVLEKSERQLFELSAMDAW